MRRFGFGFGFVAVASATIPAALSTGSVRSLSELDSMVAIACFWAILEYFDIYSENMLTIKGSIV